MVNRAKNPYLIISIFLFMAFSYFLYSTYYNYKRFNILQNSYNTISSIYNNDNLIKYIDKEIILSSRYLGTNGGVGFSKLKKSREDTNHKAFFLSKDDPNFKEELEFIRQKVDILSDNSTNDVIKKYEDLKKSLYDKLIENIDRLSFIDIVKDRLTKFKELLKQRENIVASDSFVTYILSKDSAANKTELETLDKSISLFDDTMWKIADKIVNKAVTNQNGLSYKSYRTDIDDKLKLIDDQKKDIFLSTQREFSNLVVEPNSMIYRAILALLSFMLFLFFFRRYLSIVEEEKRSLRFKDSINADAKIGKDDLKTPKIDIANSKQELRDVVLKSEIEDKDEIEEKAEDDSSLTLRAFDPLEKFSDVAKILLLELDKRDITFKYNIDKQIPNFAIFSVTKIDEILNILVEHIIKNCTHEDNFVEYQAQVVAQTKKEMAVMLKFYLKDEHTKLDSLNIKRLVKVIDANYSESKLDDRGKEFFLSLNLKK